MMKIRKLQLKDKFRIAKRKFQCLETSGIKYFDKRMSSLFLWNFYYTKEILSIVLLAYVITFPTCLIRLNGFVCVLTDVCLQDNYWFW